MTKTTPETITVLAIVADEKTITLYRDDGETTILNSNDYRTKEIVEKAMPQIAAGRKAKITISEFAIYGQFSKKTNGAVRFFRMARKAVAGIFGSHPDEEDKGEILPKPSAAQVEAYGAPVTSDSIDGEETVVAVVGTGEDARAIPHMEKLATQFTNSISGSHEGLLRFLERISKVIDSRGHSIEDLLKFLERADLPIADDGSVVAYKSLKMKDRDVRQFADVHSGNVLQRVGSHVFMDPKMVDPSRRQDCSHGLHIARRDYLSGFGGDVIVICKINPEDFIAVPQYSPSKVRVSGYHILAEVSEQARTLLKSNKGMTTESDMSKLLASILRGNHIGVIETVEITGERGGGLKITPVEGGNTAIPQMTTEEAHSLDPTGKEKPPVTGMSPKELRTQAEQIRSDVQADDSGLEVEDDGDDIIEEECYGCGELEDDCICDDAGLGEDYEDLSDKVDFYIVDDGGQMINAIKYTREWFKMGLREAKEAVEADVFMKGITRDSATQSMHFFTEKGISTAIVEQGQMGPDRVKHENKTRTMTPPAEVKDSKPLTKKQQGQALYKAWKDSDKDEDLLAILDWKKAAKKGWGALGFSDEQVKEMTDGS